MYILYLVAVQFLCKHGEIVIVIQHDCDLFLLTSVSALCFTQTKSQGEERLPDRTSMLLAPWALEKHDLNLSRYCDCALLLLCLLFSKQGVLIT